MSEIVDSALYPDQSVMEPLEVYEPIDIGKEDSFKKQDSFGLWLSSVLEVSPNSADEWQTEDSRAVGEVLDSHVTIDQSPVQGHIFCITEISPMWAFSSEKTEVIITGYFSEAQNNFGESKWSCVFGEEIVAVEIVQPGVFRCKAPPQSSDFRGRSSWTALHWAASYRKERMVAALLAARANASLVTDTTNQS